MKFTGPRGEALVYKGKGNPERRTFSNSAKQAAIIVAKQKVGLYP